MSNLRFALVLSVGLSTAAFAHQGVKDAKVKAWMHAMTEAGQASKTLGQMAKGSIPFDAETAQAVRTQLISIAGDIPALFETPASDPVSEALPSIWEGFDDFTVKSEAMSAAAEALDLSNADSLAAGMTALGRSCGGCHRSYRK